MSYSKCPSCGRAIARVRLVPAGPDPFLCMWEALLPAPQFGVFCPYDACGADLLRAQDGAAAAGAGSQPSAH